MEESFLLLCSSCKLVTGVQNPVKAGHPWRWGSSSLWEEFF